MSFTSIFSNEIIYLCLSPRRFHFHVYLFKAEQTCSTAWNQYTRCRESKDSGCTYLFSSCHVGHPFSLDSLSSLKHCKMFSIPKSVGETAVLQALMISVLLMPLVIRVSVIYHDIWFLAVILISKRETYLTGSVCLYSRIMPHNKSPSDPWFCLKAIFCYLKYNMFFFLHI